MDVLDHRVLRVAARPAGVADAQRQRDQRRSGCDDARAHPGDPRDDRRDRGGEVRCRLDHGPRVPCRRRTLPHLRRGRRRRRADPGGRLAARAARGSRHRRCHRGGLQRHPRASPLLGCGELPHDRCTHRGHRHRVRARWCGRDGRGDKHFALPGVRGTCTGRGVRREQLHVRPLGDLHLRGAPLRPGLGSAGREPVRGAHRRHPGHLRRVGSARRLLRRRQAPPPPGADRPRDGRAALRRLRRPR